MAQNDVGNKSVSVYIDDTAAHDALERLQGSADKLNTRIDEGRQKQKQLTAEIEKAKKSGASYTKLEKDLKKVNTELGKNEKALSKINDQQKKVQEQIDNKTGPSLRQQEALVRRLENEYKNLGQNTAEAAQKLEQLGKASAHLDTMRDRLNSVKKAQDGAAKSGSSFFGSFFGNLAANAVMQAGAFIEDFFRGTVDEALAAEEATARFGATLSNIGRMDAFDRIMDKADEFAARWKYLDNDDIVGVYEKLIDYGKLTENQMNDLLPVIIDFAAKHRVSLEESSSVIIKAMEGNGKALKEYGIDIKDAKTEAERMEVVMTTLKDKVDGAGEAFMNSANGGIAVMQQELANTKEQIGNELLPAINVLMKSLLGSINLLKSWGTKMGNLFSDIWAGMTGGKEAIDANRAARAAEEAAEQYDERMDATVKSIVQKIKARMEKDKSTLDEWIKIYEGNVLKNVGTQQNLQDKKVLDALNGLKNAGKVLGTGGTGSNDDDAAKKAAEARKREMDQIKKDQEALVKFLKEQELDITQFDLSEREKRLNQLAAQYEEHRHLAHGNKELLEDLEKKYLQRILQINAEYGRQQLELLKKQEEEQRKSREKFYENAVKDGMEHLQRIRKSIYGTPEKKESSDPNPSVFANLKRRRDEELNYLKEQEAAAIDQAKRTGGSVEKIEEEFRLKRLAADIRYWAAVGELVAGFAQQISDILAIDNEKKTARENAELARLQKRNDKEKAAHQKMLNGKLISQQEYNKRVKTLDDQYRAQEAAAKKKQWERQQKADVTAAVISGAQAILSALQTKPFVLGLAMSIIAGIRTKKQIDLIKNQPVPEFEKGAYLKGPLHKEGGLPIINPRTGRKVAEVEGGEVILSRKTVRNNPQLVGALLHASLHENGRPILPGFKSRPYKSLDYAGITQSVKAVRFYENGGGIPANIAGEGGGTSPQVVEVPVMTPEQEQLLQAVYKRLNEPAKAYVLLSDYEAAAGIMAGIKEDSTFKKQYSP